MTFDETQQIDGIPNLEWLTLVEEDALDPALPICDPHHHLWDQPDYRYLFEELLADLDCGHNIVSTVYVDCASMYRANAPAHLAPVGETEFVNGVAAMSASGRYGRTRVAAGIVGFADLLIGTDVDEVLATHRSASQRFRGIRQSTNWDASPDVDFYEAPAPGMLSEPKFRKGFARLAHHDLSFDAWLYHPQIPELIELAHAFPETHIILNHLGTPLGVGPYAGREREVFVEWKTLIAKLSECTNVTAKLGGLVMPINGFGFHQDDRPPTSEALAAATRQYYLHAIDCFGVDRCMFESNFPEEKVSCSYGVLWNAFKRITEHFSSSEKAALFHDTAVRIYRL
jgi:L-fuconolactonase